MSSHHFDLHLPGSLHKHRDSNDSATSSSSIASRTSPPLNPKTHKHYQSKPHVETPYPFVEHAATFGPGMSNSSFFDVQKHNHVARELSKFTSAIPNPVKATSHAVEDHVAEFRYNKYVKEAKREAKRLSQHESGHNFRLDCEHIQSNSIPEYEEVMEDWRVRDQQAWLDELKKRELARRRTTVEETRPSDLSVGWDFDEEERMKGLEQTVIPS